MCVRGYSRSVYWNIKWHEAMRSLSATAELLVNNSNAVDYDRSRVISETLSSTNRSSHKNTLQALADNNREDQQQTEHDKPRHAPQCRVLLPGEFNIIIQAPLPVSRRQMSAITVYQQQPSPSYKKLSCRREAARCFVWLSILLSRSRSFEITNLSRACVQCLVFQCYYTSVSRETIMAWPCSLGSRLLKVIENGTIQKLGCSFLFVFHSNCGRIFAVSTQYTKWQTPDTARRHRPCYMRSIARQKLNLTNRFASYRQSVVMIPIWCTVQAMNPAAPETVCRLSDSQCHNTLEQHTHTDNK